MGASLILRPKNGKFDLVVVKNYLMRLDGVVCDAADPNQYALIGDKDLANKIKTLDYKNKNSIEYHEPYVILDEANILINVHWGDNKNSDARKFTEWILASHECSATDSDGYKYADSNECEKWIKNWL